MAYKIYHNDIIKWCKEYEGEPFHSIFCDPPYHLTSISRRFGKPNSKPTRGGVYRRTSNGFMGSVWDSVDENGMGIAFDPETWAALGEHLYPGGFGMAFASSRGWHRMACAIEDAGFIIQPSLFGWCFLSGFPKATRVNTGEWSATGEMEYLSDIRSGSMHANRDTSKIYEREVKQPIGNNAIFSGHRYGGQALKPALEPLICFQRPYEGRPVDCIVKTGAGALNIDGGRIKTGDYLERVSGGSDNAIGQWGLKGGFISPHVSGRWPANFYLRHSEYCTDDECIEGCPVRLLDEQSGESVSKRSMRGEQADIRGDNYNRSNGARLSDSDSERGYDDSGPASRMFHQSTWAYEVAEQLANAEPVKYEPKASSTEREAGLDSLETQARHRVNSGGLENEPRFAPTQVKNIHPTIKPIAGNKYFATLLLPPAEYAPRRILIPFAGAGSEMIGSILAGWDEVIGIEAEANYIQIAEARLKWWSQWPGWGQNDVDTILQASGQNGQQLSFLDSQ